MFKMILTGIKVFGSGKAALEAVDDDVDLDGVKETDELKQSFERMQATASQGVKDGQSLFKLIMEKLFPELKLFFSIAQGLVQHVCEAAAGKSKKS